MSRLAFMIERPIAATQSTVSMANVVPFSPAEPPIAVQTCRPHLHDGSIERSKDVASSNNGQQRNEPSVGMES